MYFDFCDMIYGYRKAVRSDECVDGISNKNGKIWFMSCDIAHASKHLTI